MDSLLRGVRILDISDGESSLCGKILGDLGADVIKIERPGGSYYRNEGPFFKDVADGERSLSWFAFNSNKRGITLNVETSDGKVIFKSLAEKADVIIESFPVGFLSKLGLDYASISKFNPRIVFASITPFGQTGPYKDYKASDIVGMAMGGFLYLCGDPERPPVRMNANQAFLHAAIEALVGIAAALYFRELTGDGQHIDISMQQSVIPCTVQAIPFWELNQTILERSGAFRTGLTSGTKQRQTWACKDGFINFVIYGGSVGPALYRALVQWMEEEGFANDSVRRLVSPDWDVATITQKEWGDIEEPIGRFFLSHTKKELADGGAKRKFPLCPLSSLEDILHSDQLNARQFWIDVEHPELNAVIKYPGFFARLSETPCQFKRRAPLIGEHNHEIYVSELGLSKEEIIRLKQTNVI